MNNAVTCFSFSGAVDLGPSIDSRHDVATEATRCRACEGTGMAQCDACFLLDAACDCCGEPAEVLADGGLPLCHSCNVEAA